MDPVSGYILSEQIEKKRDAETWHKVTKAGLKGLNVTIQQLVGDEASGLTKLATTTLKVLKGSDLFHNLKMCLQRTKKKNQKDRIKKTIEKLEEKIKQNHL